MLFHHNVWSLWNRKLSLMSTHPNRCPGGGWNKQQCQNKLQLVVVDIAFHPHTPHTLSLNPATAHFFTPLDNAIAAYLWFRWAYARHSTPTTFNGRNCSTSMPIVRYMKIVAGLDLQRRFPPGTLFSPYGNKANGLWGWTWLGFSTLVSIIKWRLQNIFDS